MFQDVRADQTIERLIGEWPGNLVQVMDDIGERLGIEVDADRFRNADHAAANIESGRKLSHVVRVDTRGCRAARRYSKWPRSLRNGVLAQIFFQRRSRSHGVVSVNE